MTMVADVVELLQLQLQHSNPVTKTKIETGTEVSRPVPAEDVTPQKRIFPVVWSSCQNFVLS
jgi:hypothetical protein